MRNRGATRGRRAFVTAGAASGLTLLGGTARADGERSGPPSRERRNRAAVLRAFERQNAGGDLYEILHDDVEWTIVNGRTYASKAEFLTQGSAPVLDRLASTLVMTIRELWTDGDTVVVHFEGDATAVDGVAYHNEYCWIWQLRGGRVVRCHAFLDMIAVRELIERVDLP